MEFVNAPSLAPHPSGVVSHTGDPLESLAESLVRGGVLPAQEAAAALESPESGRLGRQHILSEAAAMRATLRGVFESLASARQLSSIQIASINAVLDARRTDMRLVAASGGLAWGAESTDAISRALTLVALDSVALLTSPEDLSTLRRCAGLNCDRLFIDRTKNKSGRWCEMRGCGNRAKARRFHERRRMLMSMEPDASQADGVL